MRDSAIIFDYGGTLDTRGDHWGKVIWHAYERHSVPVSEQAFRDAYVYAERTLGRENIIKPTDTFRHTLDVKLSLQFSYLRDNRLWQAADSEMEEKHEALLSSLYEGLQATVAHSRRVLLALRERGCRMVLVSNFYGNVETVLREMQLADLFVKVVESAVVGIRKPDPRIFLLGVEALDVPASQVTVVGDNYGKDILPGKEAGCRTVWLRGESWKDEDVDGKAADYQIEDISELLSDVPSIPTSYPAFSD